MNVQFYTSTYNRPELLTRLYNSLKLFSELEGFSFGWLVVYNGINHEIMSIHQNILKEKALTYDYLIISENIGLTRALNLIHDKLTAPYAVRLDDDDLLTSDSMVILKEVVNQLDENSKLGGAILDMNYPNKDIIGTPLKGYPPISNNFKLHYRLKLSGDKARVYRSEILRGLRYSEIDGELYVPDSQVYYMIDYTHDLLVVPQSLIIREYYPDGLTANLGIARNNNVIGFVENTKVILAHPDKNPIDHVIVSLNVVYYVLRCRLSLKDSIRVLSGLKIATSILIPSYILFGIKRIVGC